MSVGATSPEVTLDARYDAVRRRVADAARRDARRPEDLIIVAVTKYAEQDQVRRLIELGHRDFGENRVQHLIQRASMTAEYLSRRSVLPHAHEQHSAGGPLLGPGDVRWHMVGRLQRNKAKKAIEFCRLIHSVDSLRLAEEVQQFAVKREQPVDVLVQVNCSGEESKAGVPIAAAPHLAAQIDTMVYVRVRGLMTIAPLVADPEESRQAARECFGRCRELFDEMKTSGVGEGRFNILSMGMSGDFEEAIAQGANVLRIGSAIFGEPKHPIPDETEDED
ncbi:MAG: YggS family pyridoxal phosphate-dependent enzyme [Phycisphaerales bacterium]